jgi:hypothetical protein
LSALALETFEAVPRVAGQDLLFSGTGGRPVSGFSTAKARLDRCMLDVLRGSDEAADLPPWALHDLRRRGGLQSIPLATRLQILSMLCEGSSMRAITRITGASLNIMTKLLDYDQAAGRCRESVRRLS